MSEEILITEENELVVLNFKNKKEEEKEDNDYNKFMRKRLKNNSKRTSKITSIINENKHLKKQNRLLLASCGIKNTFEKNPIVCIQANIRGWILRKDKNVFDKSVELVLSTCRGYLQRKKFKKLRFCCIKIQKNFRGFKERNTPSGRAMRIILSYRNNIMQTKNQHVQKHKIENLEN